MNYWTGARWLDGKRFAAWLKPAVPEVGRPRMGTADPWPESLHRRLTDWQRGAKADLYDLERYLVKMNIHPGEIPDECWLGGGPPRGANILRRCPGGHLLSDRNSYRRPNGYIECRACRRARKAA